MPSSYAASRWAAVASSPPANCAGSSPRGWRSDASPRTVAARLAAIDRRVRDHASSEAAQLAREGWDLVGIRQTLCEGLGDYLAGRLRDAIEAGVDDWEGDLSGRLSALERRLADLEREAAVRQTESSRQTLGDLRKARGLS